MGQHPSIAPKEGEGSCKITELPLELLAEVLKDVDWKDILRIRQTCKRLNDASRAKAIWVDVYRRSLSTILDDSLEPPRLDRPIEMYTAADLEYTILRWASAQLGWVAPGEHPARERVISTPPSYEMHLVEGGRWLLVVDRFNAAVSYYDLEASAVSGRVLIPSVLNESGSMTSILLDVEMDHSTPTLAFNLAISVIGDPYEGDYAITGLSPLETSIAIWHVALQLDDQNAGVALSAHCLAAFMHRPQIDSQHALSLVGGHLFITVTYSFNRIEEHCIITIDWRVANGRGFHYPMQLIPRSWRAGYLRVLPNSKLLAMSALLIRLYDLSRAPVLPASMMLSLDLFQAAQCMCLPLWEVLAPGSAQSFLAFGTFISYDDFRVIFPAVIHKALYGFSINPGNSEITPPVIFKLVNIPVEYPNLGYYTTCRYCVALTSYQRNLILTKFSWSLTEENHPSPSISKDIGSESMDNSPPLIDLSSGRAVILGPNREQKIIIDFALLYKHPST